MRYVMIASCIPVLSSRKSTDIEVHKLSMLTLCFTMVLCQVDAYKRMNKVVMSSTKRHNNDRMQVQPLL